MRTQLVIKKAALGESKRVVKVWFDKTATVPWSSEDIVHYYVSKQLRALFDACRITGDSVETVIGLTVDVEVSYQKDLVAGHYLHIVNHYCNPGKPVKYSEWLAALNRDVKQEV